MLKFNVNSMKKVIFGFAGLSTVALSGCSTDYLNREEYNQVKTAAVVIYSVPVDIVSNELDAKDISQDGSSPDMNMLSFAGDLLGGVAKKTTDFLDSESHIKKQISGQEAANIALPEFVSELHRINGWNFITPVEVASNSEYQNLSARLLQDQIIKIERSSARAAQAPANYVELGLPYNHTTSVGYYQHEPFKQWAANVSKALNVDAVIVMNDTGFATDAKSIFTGGSCITKSAFHFAMFNNKGEKIADTRADFNESTVIEQSGCVSGSFHDVDYVNALKQHGIDQAKVIAAKLASIK
ncbi:hypothetical protein [Psychromonas aquimarina]|uniref:hypothetical protein n=1 Tax=Psychromonas aquimarina TaxID=444919 RepID=UPI000406670D|nr:hypothetical protein [Psychromonas aquimarina]